MPPCRGWTSTGYRFWAITKHADIMDIERQNDLFTNDPPPDPGGAGPRRQTARRPEAGAGLSTLIHIDDPHHRDLRKIGADWFRPKAMRALKARCDELAKMNVDQMWSADRRSISPKRSRSTFRCMSFWTLLGLPESDFPADAQTHPGVVRRRRQRIPAGSDKDAMIAVLMGLLQLLRDTDRVAPRKPHRDLTSAIANATINGEPLSDMDTASYYVIVASAGHDTTSAGIAGGLLELLPQPSQLRRLQNDPGLMVTAVEEMIRCVVPVKEFMRTPRPTPRCAACPSPRAKPCCCPTYRPTATKRCSTIRWRFDVGRDPNKHLSFGYGVHFCPGCRPGPHGDEQLLHRTVPRIKSIELARDPELMATTFVGGSSTSDPVLTGVISRGDPRQRR